MRPVATGLKPKHEADLREDLRSAWYKDAIIYQIHVRAFHDSDGAKTGMPPTMAA